MESIGVSSRRVEGELERFKTFIEERGIGTGAWRSEISWTRTNGGGADR